MITEDLNILYLKYGTQRIKKKHSDSIPEDGL
jgi:hypothetical protein